MSLRLSLGLDVDSVSYYQNFSFKSVFTYLLTCWHDHRLLTAQFKYYIATVMILRGRAPWNLSMSLRRPTAIRVTSSSPMAERSRDEWEIVRGWVTLRLNLRHERHDTERSETWYWCTCTPTITFRANIYEPSDREIVILQLCCWKFSHKETL